MLTDTWTDMWADTKAIYRGAGAFALAFPLLFLVPVAVEMAQHVVELHAGMYANEAGAKLAESDPLRLWFGFAKTIALLLPGYWFVRFLLLDDPKRAARIEWPAFGLWLVIFAIGAVQLWWSLFGPDLLAPLDLEGSAATTGAAVLAIAAQVLMIYLTAWIVAWPLGNARIGPFRSIAIMHGSFWYALALMVAGIVPLMAVHYGAAIVAVVWAPPALDWALMALDSVVVGFLALTMTGSGALAARRAAMRRNIRLAEGRPEAFREDRNFVLGSGLK
ncbi:MAG: hypothetical protein K5799_05465 [Erythrobacter sp.]|nr:hypothetical protein [Erythrobacter sp.]